MNLSKSILVGLALIFSLDLRAQVVVREATQAEAAAGTAGAPVYISPRRMGGGVPPGVVTNYGAATLTSGTFSNGTYGAFDINKGYSYPNGGIDTYNGGINIKPGANGGWNLANYSGGQPIADFFGNNSYGFSGGISGGQQIPTTTIWQYSDTAIHFAGGDAPINFYADIYGGSGAAMRNLPIDHDEIASAAPYPPIVFTTWNGTEFKNIDQTRCTNWLNELWTNGVITALSNNGVALTFNFQPNAEWLTAYRTPWSSAGPSYPIQGGNLIINANTFPSGTNFLRFWQARGVRMSLYMQPNRNPALTDLAFSNSWVAASGCNYHPFITPATIDNDVAQLYGWHIDDINTGTDAFPGTGFQNIFARSVAGAILNPLQSPGANYTHGYSSMYSPYGYIMSFTYYLDHPGENPDVLRNINVMGYGNSSYYGQKTGLSTFRAYSEGVRQDYKYSIASVDPGLYPCASLMQASPGSTDLEVKNMLSLGVLGHNYIQFFCPSNLNITTAHPNLFTNLLNSEFLKIHKDVTRDKMFYAFDNGTSNTFAACRKLSNGDLVVTISNEGVGTSNITVTAEQMRLNTNTTYSVLDIWAKTNMASISGSATYSLASETTLFLRLSPVAPNGLTNLIGAISYYSTNVTLVGATTLVVRFDPFTDFTTNYVVGAPNDLVGVTTSAKTPTNFTLNFTSATLTSQTIEGPLVHK